MEEDSDDSDKDAAGYNKGISMANEANLDVSL